jgi:hypothetical protein
MEAKNFTIIFLAIFAVALSFPHYHNHRGYGNQGASQLGSPSFHGINNRQDENYVYGMIRQPVYG